MVEIALKNPVREVRFPCDQVRSWIAWIHNFCFYISFIFWAVVYVAQQHVCMQTVSGDKAHEITVPKFVVAESGVLL